MNSLDSRFDRRLPLTHDLVRTLTVLSEYGGKEQLYREQFPQALATLQQVAIIQSTESSNRIEGITAPPRRIRELVAEKTTPRDRPEQEIAGYRDVLNTIHANHRAMKVTPGLVRQLHRDLFRFTTTSGGRWKSSPNSITEQRPDAKILLRFTPVAPYRVAAAMAELHDEFHVRWDAGTVSRLLLIPAYVLDFLCIHPFHDGNGRMARLLVLLLLYRAGFEVGRFVSLEKIVENSRESYYESLYLSSQHWHRGRHTLVPWTEYLLGTLLSAYRELEERVGLLTTVRGAKTQLVLNAIEHFAGHFSVATVQEACPSVSIDLIRGILKDLKRKGRARCLGRGPQASWQLI